MSKPKRVLFVPDSHWPYVDNVAWDTMLKAARVFRPDIVVVLGDFIDCYSVSSHSKDPSRISNLKAELFTAKQALKQLTGLGAKEHVYIAGNHEDRLHRYLCDKAPALLGLVSVPQALGLVDQGWRYIGYRKTFRLGKLRVTHDLGDSGMNAHRKAMGVFRHSAVVGHNHRLELSVVGNPEPAGSPAIGVSFGWLGDFDSIDYTHEAAARGAWVHGFGLGYMMQTGVVHVVPVPIVNGQCVVEGKVIGETI